MLVLFMKEKELKILTEKLKAWKEELIHEATRTVDGMTTEKAQFADPTDRASMETDRNFLLRIRDRERKLISKIDKETTVVAITGSIDGNTKPVLAGDYVTALKANGIDATYIEVPGAGHDDIVKTRDYITAIDELLKGRT